MNFFLIHIKIKLNQKHKKQIIQLVLSKINKTKAFRNYYRTNIYLNFFPSKKHNASPVDSVRKPSDDCEMQYT